MCGIVGAASHQNIVPILIEGLRRLEYRGYDSCGFAVIDAANAKHPIERARTTARVSELAEQGNQFQGTLGIAHTRWATHGALTASRLGCFSATTTETMRACPLN